MPSPPGNVEESRANARPLLTAERIWRDRYEMLESHGYRLRPRFRPGWEPSWLNTKKPLRHHEDYLTHFDRFRIDAIRISDGRKVFLKRVRTHSREIDIHRFLSDPKRLQDPDNHTAPLLDVFVDDDDRDYSYMVLPLLRLYDYPDFSTVDEVVEFMRQILEGLHYMHRHNVAHRDCSELNIMMDADGIYPKGFHPATETMDASGYKPAKPKRRRDAQGLRYYFIDFGISSIFGPDDDRRVVGVNGQDNEVPELSMDVPYDPFLTDVFIIGNLFQKVFLDTYKNLKFLERLVERMTILEWRERPGSSSSLRLFEVLVSDQSWYTLRWKLKKKSSGFVICLLQDIESAFVETLSLLGSKTRAEPIPLIKRWRSTETN